MVCDISTLHVDYSLASIVAMANRRSSTKMRAALCRTSSSTLDCRYSVSYVKEAANTGFSIHFLNIIVHNPIFFQTKVVTSDNVRESTLFQKNEDYVNTVIKTNGF